MPFYGQVPESTVDPTEPFPFDTEAGICDWCAGDRGWQPIETAPDREDGVLICDATKPRPAVGVARYIEGRWRGYDHGMGVECLWPTPTHWMPLPPPPAIATAARQGGDAKQAPAESPQSGGAKTPHRPDQSA